jgi:hypothetical protein
MTAARAERLLEEMLLAWLRDIESVPYPPMTVASLRARKEATSR